MEDDQIKAYFAFEENDLIANRNGELSEKQRKRINAADRFAERFILGLFVILLAGGLLVGILAFSIRDNIGLWIGMVILFLLAAWAFRGARTDVDDAVQKAEGKIDIVKVENMSGSANNPAPHRMTISGYEMRVGGEVFPNINPVLIEYMQSEPYLVYFTKTTRQILSAEPVSNAAQIQTESESTPPMPS
jgi:hypothetical protein